MRKKDYGVSAAIAVLIVAIPNLGHAYQASPADSVAVATSAGSSGSEEILSNDTVLKLLGAGIGEAAVIAKIKTSGSAFNLSTDELIRLSSKGASGVVIAAMIEAAQPAKRVDQELSLDAADPVVPHYTGVYVLNAEPGDGKMTRINPTSSNQAKTGGLFGYALTMGIASMSVKATVPGANAKVKARAERPVFYFYFDESIPRSAQGNGVSTWSNGVGTVASSPSELSLIRFVMKKDAREAKVGSINIAGAKSGVMDRDRIPFQSDLVSPGIFRVTPSIALKPGEYGFIHALSGGGGSLAGSGAMTARVFDFSTVR